MNTDLTIQDLNPWLQDGERQGVAVYRLFAQFLINRGRSVKLSQIRLIFRDVYGADVEAGMYQEYYLSIGGRQCSKCGGNGKYAMAVIDGRLWSATGTTCFKCNGAGYVMRKTRNATV